MIRIEGNGWVVIIGEAIARFWVVGLENTSHDVTAEPRDMGFRDVSAMRSWFVMHMTYDPASIIGMLNAMADAADAPDTEHGTPCALPAGG